MSSDTIALAVVAVAALLLVIGALARWDRRQVAADDSADPRAARPGRDAGGDRPVGLPTAVAGRYRREWLVLHQQYADDPETAVRLAHELVVRMRRERGYPAGAGADEPVELRVAEQIQSRSRSGAASTEDLRRALRHYGALFDRLVSDATSRGTPTDPAA